MRRAAAVLLLATAALQAQTQEFKLPSGLRCVLLEKHDQPLIRLELVTRWDPAEETKEGRGGFLALMLGAGGAGPYTRPDFNRAVDDLGLACAFQSRRNAYRWTLAADSRSQEPALELLADAVFRPVFDGALVEAQRQALLRQAAGAPPRAAASAGFLWSLRDPDTDLPPTSDGLKTIALDDLQAFRRRVLRPEASTLVLYGDLSLAQAKELIFLHFGLWGPALQPAQAPAPPGGPAPKLAVELDTAGDGELWAGRGPFPGPAPVAELLGVLLDQTPPAAVPGVLVTCALGPGRPLLIKVKAGASSRRALVPALLDTLASLRARGFTQEEVDRARLSWKARMTALPLHPARLLQRLQDGLLDPAFQARMDELGPKELNAALASLLAPEALHYLLLGADDELVKAAEQAGLAPPKMQKPAP
jgi:predicted Zn-dependent peptidase